MSDRVRAWHFLSQDRRLGFDDCREVEAGKVYASPGDRAPELCAWGMHASERPLDALSYAPGPVLCRVEIWGDVVRGEDKVCGRRRRVLWCMDVSPLLHEFACRCAEAALELAGCDDVRCRAAIEAKRAWVRGEISDEQLAAASAAASDAARAAASAAARDAAWAAAWAAARTASSVASRDASRAAARAAASAASWDAQNAMLEQLIEDARRLAGKPDTEDDDEG